MNKAETLVDAHIYLLNEGTKRQNMCDAVGSTSD